MTASAEARDTALLAAQAAADKLATDVSIVDVSERLAITDAFVLASAPNERQVQAIVDAVEERLREHGIKPVRREGMTENRWVLLDFVDVVVHVQHAEERAYYALERLWKDCPTIPFVDSALPAQAAAEPSTPEDGEPARGRRADAGHARAGDSDAALALPVRRLILWRHGRTEWNADGTIPGPAGPAAGRGRPPAGRRGGAAPGRLGALGADTVVVSSDLERAADTATALTGLLGVPLPLDPRLREHGMGSWEGLTRDEVADRYPEQYADWLAGRPVRGRGGEEPEEVAERALAALAGAAAGPCGGGGHARRHERAPHRAAARARAGQRRLFGPLGNCAWSELQEQSGAWRLMRHNVAAPTVRRGRRRRRAPPRPGGRGRPRAGGREPGGGRRRPDRGRRRVV